MHDASPVIATPDDPATEARRTRIAACAAPSRDATGGGGSGRPLAPDRRSIGSECANLMSACHRATAYTGCTERRTAQAPCGAGWEMSAFDP